ncbi:hypothetical protein CAEBREN_13091 [Caenorhabditis brenneri]|uniref:Uncharacterized protein n=1 Tax=Caenorhabditis brenneri TaxID=135651 RepID=G0MMR3_CAEBE|nr:hypothetical protein CAEBREN_13091 [Caenorhabditis brenneri]
MPIQTLRKPESRYLARGFVVYRISSTVIMLHLSNEAIWCTYKDHYDVHTFYEGAPIILPEGWDMFRC